MNNDKKAFLFAAIAVILWASAFAAIRASLLGGYSPASLVLVRFLIASALFVIYFLLPGVHFRFPNKEDLLRITVLGWIGITVYHIGVTFGVETITAGTAGMIIGSAPIFTSIIAAIVLKERIELFGWIGLGIGFFGIILITLGTSGASFAISKGTLFVLMSAIATSVFFVFQKPLLARYNPIHLTAYFTWAGTIPLLVFFPGLWESIQTATTGAHLSAIYVGVFPAAIAYAIWAIALSLGNASSVSSMMYIEPALAIIIAWFWLNEWPSVLSLIGGTIAISSVFIVNFVGRKRRLKKKDLEHM